MMRKIVSIILILAMLFSCGCSNEASVQSDVSFGEDWLLNTYCYIKIFEAGKEDLIKSSFKYARYLEAELSKTIESSAVSKINNAPAQTGINFDDGEFVNAGVVLGRALQFMNESEGLFDPSIGAVSKLWDFTSGEGTLPKDLDIQNALQYVGMGMLSVSDDGTLTKAYDEVEIDLGAIAKGYIAQCVANSLRDSGVTCAILSFGGNIVIIGEKYDDSDWQIGIEAPSINHNGEPLEERESVGFVHWDGKSLDVDAINSGNTPALSVVTSGTYERFIKDGEKIYHHILDPRTGYSAETDLASATIIGPDSMCCDAIATIAILKGSEGAANYVEEYNKAWGAEYQYVFITNDGEIIKSEDSNFSE